MCVEFKNHNFELACLSEFSRKAQKTEKNRSHVCGKITVITLQWLSFRVLKAHDNPRRCRKENINELKKVGLASLKINSDMIFFLKLRTGALVSFKWPRFGRTLFCSFAFQLIYAEICVEFKNHNFRLARLSKFLRNTPKTEKNSESLSWKITVLLLRWL